MKTSQKILVFFAMIGSVLWLRLGGYLIWSTFHRLTADRKWKDVVLPKLTIDQAAERMAKFVWKEDDKSELYDAVCTPQKVEACGFSDDAEQSPHGNDCDEESVWLNNVLEDPSILEKYFFTVTWYDPSTGKFAGHNVCLMRQAEGWRYMDYGTPRPVCISPHDVALMIVRNYGGRIAVLVAAVASDKKLFPKFVA